MAKLLATITLNDAESVTDAASAEVNVNLKLESSYGIIHLLIHSGSCIAEVLAALILLYEHYFKAIPFVNE